MPLRCFIAMAFDHPDTDRLFDGSIRPLLRRKDISPFRVDRSNRNDDVDDQILFELQRSDFAIVDLTYARPSVYFEAGVASGRDVPVIYTCRRDHFRHRPDDLHGNYRVHFDLQMKPIIKWDDPPVRAFSRQLEERVAPIVRKLLLQRRTADAARTDQIAFAALSLSEKLSRTDRLYDRLVYGRGFRVIAANNFALRRRNSFLFFEERSDFSFSRSDLRSSTMGYQDALGGAVQLHIVGRRLPERIERHSFIFSISSIPESRVAAALPAYAVAKTENEITATASARFRIRREGTIPGQFCSPNAEGVWVPFTNRLHVISGITSRGALKTSLEAILSGIV